MTVSPLTTTLAETQADQQSTRDREAMRLFAERGYRATTVGDIEAAGGLAQRRGSFYRHFGSKEEVLRAGLQRHAGRVEAMQSVLDLLPLGDPQAEFLLLARWSLHELARERDLIRLFQQEGRHFPALAEYGQRINDRGYRNGTEWMRRLVEDGRLPDLDCEAVTVILLGAMISYRVEESMFGRPPAGVDEERFLHGLSDVWAALSRRDDDGLAV